MKCKCGANSFIAIESWCLGGEFKDEILHLRNPGERGIDKVVCEMCWEELEGDFEIEVL